MKKYKITSEAYVGQVDVWYNEAGNLCYLDMTHVLGSAKITSLLLYQIPYDVKKIKRLDGFINMFKLEEVEG